jgi:LysM repeat protein
VYAELRFSEIQEALALRNLFLKWNRLLLLAALLLSGCFRPAGDSIQPTSDFTAEAFVNPGAQATTPAPAITMLSPDATALPPPTDALPVITQITLEPPTETPTPSHTPSDPTSTLQIITPGISLGLLTPDTPIPQSFVTPSPEGSITLIGEATEDVGISEQTTSDECSYTVEAGDTLYRIALEYETTVEDLLAANPQLVGDEPILQIDEVLTIPDCEPGVIRPTRIPSATEEATDEIPPGGEIYVVQPGDVLGAIASRYGVTVRAIMDANGLTDPDRLDIGQELIIPPRQE